MHDPGDHVSLRLSKTDLGGPGLKNGFRVLLDDNGVPDAGVFGTGVERCSAGAGVGGGFFFDGNLSLHDPGAHIPLRLSITDRGGPGLKNVFLVLLDDIDVSDAGVFGTGVEIFPAGAGVRGEFLCEDNDESGGDVLGTGVER